MNKANIPHDLKAEVLLAYVAREHFDVDVVGTHKRNAYLDIVDIATDDAVKDEMDKQHVHVTVARDSFYDILPEGMFHPLDRFDNIPANDYQRCFADECEKERQEEINARRFFKPADTCIMMLNCLVADMKQHLYGGNKVLSDIICDSMSEELRNNRFVAAAIPFLPLCSHIRGDKTLLCMMLRKIFSDEGLKFDVSEETVAIYDNEPRYNCYMDAVANLSNDFYMGDAFSEQVITYTIHYWSDDECNEQFMTFVAEMSMFETFINDYFISVEECLKFDISNDERQVILSDDNFNNYLNYNSNI